MKKYLLILFTLLSICGYSQRTNTFKDSSIFYKAVVFDSTIYITKGASNGKVLTSNGIGLATWQTINVGGRSVDTIYKNNTKDSIVFTISGIRYAVKDSIGVTDLSGYALQSSLNDTANTLRRIRKVDSSYLFKNATRDSICMVTVINGNTYRTCAFDSSNVNTDSQSLQLFFTDSILLGITRGNSIKFAYAVDSVGLNAGGDSIVVIKAGLRLAYKIGSSGGGSLSSLTSATATNIINNGNFQQEWQWNSLANNTGFKLSSTSGGLLNTQNRLLDVQMSGAMPGTGSSSYSGYFKNTQTGGSAIGLYAEGTVTAINAVGNINTSTTYLINNDFSLSNTAAGSNVKAASSSRLNLRGDNLINFQNIAGTINYASINNITDNVRQSLLFNGVYSGGQFYCSATTSAIVERSSDKLIFSANSGLTANTSFTPNNIMTVYGTNSNVGIGTTTPVASAKLEVSSTTSGFLPPRMTATQASAISSPAQGLLLFVTDTDGTFTSVGWWGYNGATWEKLNN